MRWFSVGLCLVFTTTGAWAQSGPSAAFAFVLFGQGSDGSTVPMVRSVVEGGKSCPLLQARAGSDALQMVPRRPPDGGRFDEVLVCEALYPVGEKGSVILDDARIELPAVSLGTARRIVLLGDTGCRGNTLQKPQPCTGRGFGAAWPFGTLADDGTLPPPDLIIHVGDYNYRGTPESIVLPPHATGYGRDFTVKVYDTGDLDDEDEPQDVIGPAYWSQNIQGSPTPDQWAAWRDDFFRPAAKLLTAAPWVLSRGNHELCSRAGPGWFYLLDPESPLLGSGRRQAACPAQTPDGWRAGAWPAPPVLPFAGQRFPTDPSPPYRLRFGDLDLVMVDSSNAGDAVRYNYDEYVEQYRSVAEMLAEGRPSWLVTHRPIWGVVRKSKGGPAGGAPYGFINVTQQDAVATVFPRGLPANLTAVMSGHMHRFQATSFAGRRPPQLVVGTGGMELSQTQPVPPPRDPADPVVVPGLNGQDATVVGRSEFGVMVLEPGPAGSWKGIWLGSAGETLADCDSAWAREGDGRPVCALR